MNPFKTIFKHQHWHLLAVLILLVVLWKFATSDLTFLSGSLWGMSTFEWFLIAVAVPILHQVYVLIIWRSELHFKGFTKLLGHRAFKLYKFGFGLFMISRLASVIILAISNANSIQLSLALSIVLSLVFLVPSIYLFYSVARYFGFDRAVGMDHFNPEVARESQFVKEGIFKYTSNAMYIYGFLVLWIPGIFLGSKAAISVALFSHIYIWVHYYCTELPDMKVIYKQE